MYRICSLMLSLAIGFSAPAAAQSGSGRATVDPPNELRDPAGVAAAVVHLTPGSFGSLYESQVLTPKLHAEVTRAARARQRFPIDYGTGVRRVLLMGLTGAAGGALAGMAMEVVDPHGEIADVWPVLLAIPGFVGGVVYSLVR